MTSPIAAHDASGRMRSVGGEGGGDPIKSSISFGHAGFT
jgi:hypothetical protein